MPLTDTRRENQIGLWRLQYPFLAPNLGSAAKLQGMVDLYGNMAQRAQLSADAAGFRDFSTRALQAKQALRELYGIDYSSGGMSKMNYQPGSLEQMANGQRNMVYNTDPTRTVNTRIPNVYRGQLSPEGELDRGIPDPNDWKARI